MKIFLVFLTFGLNIYAHSGKLDIYGGHTNKSTGKYHYHTAKKGSNTNAFNSPIRIQILKYGAPYSWGQSFSSIQRCTAKIKMLALQNKDTDYTYICAIK